MSLSLFSSSASRLVVSPWIWPRLLAFISWIVGELIGCLWYGFVLTSYQVEPRCKWSDYTTKCFQLLDLLHIRSLKVEFRKCQQFAWAILSLTSLQRLWTELIVWDNTDPSRPSSLLLKTVLRAVLYRQVQYLLSKTNWGSWRGRSVAREEVSDDQRDPVDWWSSYGSIDSRRRMWQRWTIIDISWTVFSLRPIAKLLVPSKYFDFFESTRLLKLSIQLWIAKEIVFAVGGLD